MIKENVSLKIGLGAFICAIEIALFHAPGTWAKLTPAAEGLYKAIEPLTQMSLAFFFTVAGFLVQGKITNLQTYLKIIAKRIQTLVIPFVLWNLIFLGCVWLMFMSLSHWNIVKEFSSLMPGGGSRWLNFDALSFVRNCPNPVLWFLRTLFVLIVLVPFFLLALTKLELGGL